MGVRPVHVLLLVLPLIGCFDEPVAAPQGRQLESALLGEWVCVPADAEQAGAATVLIGDAGQGEYKVAWVEDGKTDHYRAYPVVVAGTELLSVIQVNEAGEKTFPGDWLAVLVTRESATRFSLDGPSKEILDLPEAEGLQRLRAAANLAALWHPIARCQAERRAPS